MGAYSHNRIMMIRYKELQERNDWEKDLKSFNHFQTTLTETP